MDRAIACRLGTFGAAVVAVAAVSAIAAASAAPTLPLAIAGIAGAAGNALAGVASGIVANDLGAIDGQLGEPDLRNAHLTRAVGRAIAIVIEDVAKDHKGRSRRALKALAQTARQDWPQIVRESLGNQTPAELFEENLAANYFATAPANFDQMRALATWEDWRIVIDTLRHRVRRGKRFRRWLSGAVYPLRALNQGQVDTLAQRLHQDFPRAIREVLKRDFAEGKEAFAGMVFDLLGNLTGGQQELAKQVTQWRSQTHSLSQALAEQLTMQLLWLEGVVIDQGTQTREIVQEEHEKTRTEIIQEFRKNPTLQSQNPHSPSNLSRYGRTVPKFVGREVAMAELSQLLAETDQVAVSGMGGLGKTELAWRWADREYQAGNFPGGVVWLDVAAGNPGDQLLLFYQTTFAVEIPQELPTVSDRVAYCWQHWPREGAVLVVLDDVVRERDGAQLAMFRPGGRFRVLRTTRERWTGVQDYPLDQLSDEAARELLTSYIDLGRLEAEPEAVADLLRWFGGLPLGLELAGRYLALYKISLIAKYVEGLHLTHKSLDPNIEMGYPHGLEAALAFSWARLDGEAARGLALRLGLYGAAAIPLREDEQQEWEEALNGLLNLNLLEGEGNLVRLHPLVRQFVRQRLAVELSPKAVNELRREVAGAIVEQGERIPYRFTMAQAREFAPWIPHLEEVAGELLPWVGDEDVISPCTRIAWYYQGQGLYNVAQPWLEQGVAVVRVRLGNQHRSTATALNNLAFLYGEQGKYPAAEPLFLESLKIDRESLPFNHPDLAIHLNNLGQLYNEQGKYPAAEPRFLEALAIVRESLPPNHPQLALHLNNLALLYKEQRNYAAAEPLYLEALAIDRESLSPNHPDLTLHLSNLALLYKEQGNYAAAESFYLEALEIDRESLPPHHPQLANHLNNLATLYYAQGKYPAAEPLFLEALEIDRERLPPHHPQLANHLNNLAELYREQGKYSAAEPLFLEALKIDRESLPFNHPQLAILLNNLANLYYAQGKYPAAEPLFLEALKIDRERLPPNHPRLVTHLKNLGNLYYAQGKYPAAEPLYLEALEIHRESLSPNHPRLATYLNNLAELYREQGKYTAAEPLFLESLSILIETQSVNLQAVWNNVIDFYRTALAAGLPDTTLRQHPLGPTILSRL